MVTLDGQAVLDWRNSMMRLPDHKFIMLMHLYLGEIKTPYRKENLLSGISEYFKIPEVRNDLLSRIDEVDSLIISAICLLKFATEKKLSRFLKGKISTEILKSKLNNLEKRLLIYKKEFKDTWIFVLTPLFPELNDFRSDWNFFPSVFPEKIKCGNLSLCSTFLPENLELFFITFIFFMEKSGTPFKNTGELKKTFIDSLDKIFPEISGGIPPLSYGDDFTARTRLCITIDVIHNLGLIMQDDKKIIISRERLKHFAALLPANRIYSFLIASAGRFTGKDVSIFSGILEFVFSYIQENRITAEELPFLFYCAYNINQFEDVVPAVKEKKFSALLRESAETLSSGDIESFIWEAGEKIFFTAFSFGILKIECGLVKLFDGFISLNQRDKTKSERLIVESVFSVLIFPGIDLCSLIKIIPFLNPVSCQTLSTFSLTKESVFFALGKGENPEDFLSVLENTSCRKLPANFLFSFNEWVSAWKSCLIYTGSVLVVDAEKKALYENNRKFMDEVKKILAPGVFLLKEGKGENALENVRNSGVEASLFPEEVLFSDAGTGYTKKTGQPGINASILRDSFSVANVSENKIKSLNWSDEQLKKMVMNSREISEEQKKIFITLIQNKLVLSPSQINPFTISTQVFEVSGFDYTGKIRILENSVKTSGAIKITVSEGGQNKVYTGKCKKIEKNNTDIRVYLRTGNQDLIFPLTRISKVEEIPDIVDIFF